jgi:rifampicin phosphotransferase
LNPRWREDPSYLLENIKTMLDSADLEKFRQGQQDKGEKASKEIEKAVPFYKRFALKWLVSQAIKGAELRELSKSEIVRVVEPARRLALEMGRRLAAKGILDWCEDIFHCSPSELFSLASGDWDGNGLKTLVSERKQKRVELEALSPPDVILGDVPQFAAAVHAAPGEALVGLGVASGRAAGKARLLTQPRAGINKGEILVAPSTDPAWTPLFLQAAAVVMETGGFLSHGAIVAREYGIPAVVNIPGVMKLLKDGEEIIVDGDEGKVYRLER